MLESLCLFSLSVAFEAADNLMVELLLARLVELPFEVVYSVVLCVWRTLLFFSPRFWPLLFTVVFTSPPDVLLDSCAFWCRFAYLFMMNEEFCWALAGSNLLSILI